MKFRKIISLTAMVSFTVLVLTGIVLFIQPHGRVAYWVDWRLWGLSKTQWDSTHIHAGILFVLAIVLHLYYNWRSIVSYLKGKADQFRVFSLHFNIALLITSVVVFGTIAGTPPFCWVMDLNESIKETAVKTYGKPPYGHAELSSMKTLAFRMGFDLDKSIQGLKTAGINFEGVNQRIVDIIYLKALFLSLSRSRRITADLLVVTVMMVSFLAGQPLSGALVAWFISMGLAISFAIIERTRRKIEALTKEGSKAVRVVRDDTILELPVEQVRQGDVAIIPQGEMIPVDGEIVDGASSIDESVITGEPFSVFKKAGDFVTSGAIALHAQLKVRAAKAGDKTFMYVIGKEIEKSLKVKPKIHRTADKILQFFISAVVLYAIGVFLFTGGLAGDFSAGLIRMAAVTAVACPCAWALSVPTAFAAAIGGLSGRGILVRGGTPLEMAARVVNAVLDKTGTVTIGEPKVAGIESFDLSQDKLLQIAASVEAGFNHPIANAIISHASANGVRPLKAERSEYLPGLGIKSSVEGSEVVLGSDETMSALGMAAPLDLKIKGRAVWIGIDGKIAGAIVIQDELRDYAKGLGHALHELGMRRVELATGDNEASEARRVAELIGADAYHWGLKPEEKTAIVKNLSVQGPTVMVGDGVNDAMSLAAADVGISIGRDKADLAIQSSDIIVLQDDATSLLAIIRTGRKLIGARYIIYNFLSEQRRESVMNTQVTTVEARNRFSNLVNRAAFGKERTVLTRRGEEVAAVVPIEDVKLLEELENQIDLRDARAALREAKKKGTKPLSVFKKELGL
jgi:Cu+-exporting ATPase